MKSNVDIIKRIKNCYIIIAKRSNQNIVDEARHTIKILKWVLKDEAY